MPVSQVGEYGALKWTITVGLENRKRALPTDVMLRVVWGALAVGGEGRVRVAARMLMPGIEMHLGEGNGMFLWDLLGLCFCGNLLMEMLKRK